MPNLRVRVGRLSERCDGSPAREPDDAATHRSRRAVSGQRAVASARGSSRAAGALTRGRPGSGSGRGPGPAERQVPARPVSGSGPAGSASGGRARSCAPSGASSSTSSRLPDRSGRTPTSRFTAARLCRTASSGRALHDPVRRGGAFARGRELRARGSQDRRRVRVAELSTMSTRGHEPRGRAPPTGRVRSGEAVHLDRDACLQQRRVKTSSRSSAFSGPMVEDAALRMAERANRRCRIAVVTIFVELCGRSPLTCVQAELHPLEPARHVLLRRRASPSARMSHSTPREDAERSQRRSRCAISSPCRRSSSDVRPCTTPTLGVWSQIARYAYPRSRAAAPSRGLRPRHPTTSCGSAGRRRNVRQLYEPLGRRSRTGQLAELRWAEGKAEDGELLGLVRKSRATGRAPRRTRRILLRGTSSVPSVRRRDDEHVTGHAVERQAAGASFCERSRSAMICGRAANASSARPGRIRRRRRARSSCRARRNGGRRRSMPAQRSCDLRD
jgi:hypothetical protein